MPEPLHAVTAYRHIMDSVSRCAAGAGRSAPVVIAVSKTRTAEEILPLLEAGHRHFGENRVQEAQAKWPALKAAFPDAVLHLIGPLQTNKAKTAAELFDAIHSLDRPSLAAALAAAFDQTGRRLPLFIQVNTGREPQKAGVLPEALEDFYADCATRPALTVAGLMCIPPAEENPAPHFAWLADRGRRLGLKNLSMGMSGDYEAAIRLGASHVRIGTALFGARG